MFHRFGDRLQQWESTPATPISIVVVIDGPDEDARQAVCNGELGLVVETELVIKANPLVEQLQMCCNSVLVLTQSHCRMAKVKITKLDGAKRESISEFVLVC